MMAEMVIHEIDSFRRAHCKHDIKWVDTHVNHYCREHSLAMLNAGHLFHAPQHFLEDWSEAVAMCTKRHSAHMTICELIWNAIGQSGDHMALILEKDIIACGMVMDDKYAYLTIRGK